MDRKFFKTGLKPGQNEDFWTYWGWSILVPACPGWGSTKIEFEVNLQQVLFS
jgi:hypothetical protein